MTRMCGHSFISYSKTPVHLIPLAGKMTLYGTRIAYIYVRNPNSKKCSFGIENLSSRRALRIFKNLPQAQEGIFWDGHKSDI